MNILNSADYDTILDNLICFHKMIQTAASFNVRWKNLMQLFAFCFELKKFYVSYYSM